MCVALASLPRRLDFCSADRPFRLSPHFFSSSCTQARSHMEQSVHGLYTACTRPVHGLYTACTRPVHGLYMACTVYTVCTRSVPGLCTVISVTTVFDLISEHTLISGHPHFCSFFFFFLLIIISSDFCEGNTNLLYTGLMVTMVKTIARAHRDLCVLAYCVIVLHHAIDI